MSSFSQTVIMIVGFLIAGVGLAMWSLFAITVIHALDYRWAGIVDIELRLTELMIHRDLGAYQNSFITFPTGPVWLGSVFIASGCTLNYFTHR